MHTQSSRGPARRRTAAALLALSTALLPVFACFSERDDAMGPVDGDDCTVPASAIGPNRTVVLIRGFRFLGDTLRVRPGTLVTWVNCEADNIEPHTTTSETAVWDSGPVAPGASFARSFDAAGTFPYFCQPHPSMRGVVIVE